MEDISRVVVNTMEQAQQVWKEIGNTKAEQEEKSKVILKQIQTLCTSVLHTEIAELENTRTCLAKELSRVRQLEVELDEKDSTHKIAEAPKTLRLQLHAAQNRAESLMIIKNKKIAETKVYITEMHELEESLGEKRTTLDETAVGLATVLTVQLRIKELKKMQSRRKHWLQEVCAALGVLQIALGELPHNSDDGEHTAVKCQEVVKVVYKMAKGMKHDNNLLDSHLQLKFLFYMQKYTESYYAEAFRRRSEVKDLSTKIWRLWWELELPITIWVQIPGQSQARLQEAFPEDSKALETGMWTELSDAQKSRLVCEILHSIYPESKQVLNSDTNPRAVLEQMHDFLGGRVPNEDIEKNVREGLEAVDWKNVWHTIDNDAVDSCEETWLTEDTMEIIEKEHDKLLILRKRKLLNILLTNQALLWNLLYFKMHISPYSLCVLPQLKEHWKTLTEARSSGKGHEAVEGNLIETYQLVLNHLEEAAGEIQSLCRVVGKMESFIAAHAEYRDLMNDPNRALMMKGGKGAPRFDTKRFLKEEKLRNMVVRDMPNAVKAARAKLSKIEKKWGGPLRLLVENSKPTGWRFPATREQCSRCLASFLDTALHQSKEGGWTDVVVGDLVQKAETLQEGSTLGVNRSTKSKDKKATEARRNSDFVETAAETAAPHEVVGRQQSLPSTAVEAFHKAFVDPAKDAGELQMQSQPRRGSAEVGTSAARGRSVNAVTGRTRAVGSRGSRAERAESINIGANLRILKRRGSGNMMRGINRNEPKVSADRESKEDAKEEENKMAQPTNQKDPASNGFVPLNNNSKVFNRRFASGCGPQWANIQPEVQNRVQNVLDQLEQWNAASASKELTLKDLSTHK
eukprot:Platyproteum_vivax@DN7153_c0_g1_i1.p1